MRLYFLFSLLLVVILQTHAGLLAEVRGIFSVAKNTITGQATRLSRLAQRLNNKRHQAGNETVILDVTLDSLADTIAYLTAENELLRTTNAELRSVSRKQKQWLSIVRREAAARLDEAAKRHVVDKEELRNRLGTEHKKEIETIKKEMMLQLEKIDAEAKRQQTQQAQQIAGLEEMKLASAKSLAEVKRELREKEAAMNSLSEKNDKLKREQQANDELKKELVKRKQQAKIELAKEEVKGDTSSLAEEKAGVRSNSMKKNAPIDIEPPQPIATENESKSSGSNTKLSSGSSVFPPKPKTVSKSSRSRNPKPRSSSKGSK